MTLFLETFEVWNLIEQVVTTVQPQLGKNGNTLIVNCDRNIGTIYSDSSKLRQALLNLASNAAKFTDRGKITINVWKEEGDVLPIGNSEEALGRFFWMSPAFDRVSSHRYWHRYD